MNEGVGVGGVLDQMKIRLTLPSFTETGAWAELGNKLCHCVHATTVTQYTYTPIDWLCTNLRDYQLRRTLAISSVKMKAMMSSVGFNLWPDLKSQNFAKSLLSVTPLIVITMVSLTTFLIFWPQFQKSRAG